MVTPTNKVPVMMLLLATPVAAASAATAIEGQHPGQANLGPNTVTMWTRSPDTKKVGAVSTTHTDTLTTGNRKLLGYGDLISAAAGSGNKDANIGPKPDAISAPKALDATITGWGRNLLSVPNMVVTEQTGVASAGANAGGMYADAIATGTSHSNAATGNNRKLMGGIVGKFYDKSIPVPSVRGASGESMGSVRSNSIAP